MSHGLYLSDSKCQLSKSRYVKINCGTYTLGATVRVDSKWRVFRTLSSSRELAIVICAVPKNRPVDEQFATVKAVLGGLTVEALRTLPWYVETGTKGP
jgi:hypothetical protein